MLYMYDRKIYISKLFPNCTEKNIINKLKIDDESVTYISSPIDANNITKIILSHVQKYNHNPKTMSIIDITAGVGGNVISFANKFKHVSAIEIVPIRYEYLCNNINVYNLTNVSCFNGDSLQILSSLPEHEIVFIDPPWGGAKYKNTSSLRLNINNMSIEQCCLDIFSLYNASFVIIKLPINYDVKYFKECNKSYSVTIHNLPKMLIAVVKK